MATKLISFVVLIALIGIAAAGTCARPYWDIPSIGQYCVCNFGFITCHKYKQQPQFPTPVVTSPYNRGKRSLPDNYVPVGYGPSGYVPEQYKPANYYPDGDGSFRNAYSAYIPGVNVPRHPYGGSSYRPPYHYVPQNRQPYHYVPQYRPRYNATRSPFYSPYSHYYPTDYHSWKVDHYYQGQ